MKKFLAGLFFLVSIFSMQCDKLSQNTLMDTNESVRIAIAVPPQFDTIAQYAIVRVSGNNMDTIKEPLTVSDSFISGTVNNIPVGRGRFFEVEVYSFIGVMIYYGSCYADIRAGEPTYVTINLRAPNGSAIINGRIIDDTVPSESLWISTPAIIQYNQIPDSGIVNRIQFSVYYRSYSIVNKLYWIVDQSDSAVRVDSGYGFSSGQFSYIFNGTGSHSVKVVLRQNMTTIVSEPLLFRIVRVGLNESRIVVCDSLNCDTIPPVDTIPPNFPPDTVLRQFTLPAKEGALQTGLSVQSGDVLMISASGYWSMDSVKNRYCGPSGDTATYASTSLYPSFPLGALLGEIRSGGNSSKPFLIGSNFSSQISSSGTLDLLPNRFIPRKQGNESGTVTVNVRIVKHRGFTD